MEFLQVHFFLYLTAHLLPGTALAYSSLSPIEIGDPKWIVSIDSGKSGDGNRDFFRRRTMNKKLQVLMLVFVALLGLVPGAAEAQQAGTKPPVPHDHVLSANPFLLLFEWANAEYEHKISSTGTVGLAGSWISLDEGNEDYRSLNAFFRYYPQGAALTGFYFGGHGGVHHVSDVDVDVAEDEVTVFGLGLDVGYSWLLGANRNFYIGLGIGATRLFGGDLDDDSGTIPTIRLLNIGWAF